MSGHQDIVWNVTGQSLYLDVPEGVPSSVTAVSVFEWRDGDDATAESATTGSAAIDSVSTTFDAASGPSSADPTLLNLAATTSIVAGRQYLATDAEGRKEWPTITGIVSGASVTALLGLGLDYVTGDAFEGTRISISVDSTWVADTGNINDGLEAFDRYRVRWEYVVGGVTYVRTTTFSLVRKVGALTVTPGDIDLRYPGVLAHFPDDYRYERAAHLIDKAYELFSRDLLNVRIPDELIVAPGHVDALVEMKTVAMAGVAHEMGGGGSAMRELAERDYDFMFRSLFATPDRAKVPIGVDDTGAASSRAPRPFSVL